AKVNVACTSTRIQNIRDLRSLFVIQVEALKQLKEANPSGRFWIKLDGTDVESALMESMRRWKTASTKESV
ncbi:hypothetical protein QZH41_010821, partial [Actinostola sp. cb2023]